MKILVTGAKGMLGRDLCPMLEDNDFDVIETDIENLDITNELQVNSVLKKECPDFVIHCAAYTNVDKAEDEKDLAEKINSTATEYIAKATKKIGATLIYISTDYVFDGTKNSPYMPDDEPNPINEYGKSKLNGETAIQKICDKYYILRTSWLYGHHGKNFVETMLSLKDQTELNVVDDQNGCPTWTVDLSDAIISIIEENPEYGIYHTCGAGSTSWYGFAKEIFKLSKIEVNLKSCNTNEYPRPAKRPKYSIMDNDGILRDWKLALKDYLELRVE